MQDSERYLPREVPAEDSVPSPRRGLVQDSEFYIPREVNKSENEDAASPKRFDVSDFDNECPVYENVGSKQRRRSKSTRENNTVPRYIAHK